MSDSPLVLYSFWRSTAAYRVRVAARLKQIALDERFIDLDAGEQHEAAFRRINPMGAVPALVVDEGPPLTESLAMIEYLDTLAPARTPLLPTDARGQARVRAIAQTVAADLHPLLVPRIGNYLKDGGFFDEADWRAWQRHWASEGLQGVEQQLANHPDTGMFCHHNTLSLADIAVVTVVDILAIFDIHIADIPIIDGIVARCRCLSAFAESAPLAQPGALARPRA